MHQSRTVLATNVLNEDPTILRPHAWEKLSRNIGMNPVKKYQGQHHWQARPNTRAFVFMALLKVLAVTKSAGIYDHEYCIETLDLCCRHRNYGINIGSGYPPLSGLDWSAWDPAFQHLRCRKLHLSLRSYSGHLHGPPRSLPDTDTPFMHALAETTPHLRTLALGYKNWSPAGFVSLSKSVRLT